jgi:hypothetical protein
MHLNGVIRGGMDGRKGKAWSEGADRDKLDMKKWRFSVYIA